MAGQENRIVGAAIAIDSIAIATGNRWVLVGSVTNATATANLTSDPAGAIIAGTLYTFSSGVYSHPTTLDPMKGYWVFINAPCTLKVSQ